MLLVLLKTMTYAGYLEHTKRMLIQCLFHYKNATNTFYQLNKCITITGALYICRKRKVRSCERIQVTCPKYVKCLTI